jgi:hypothetical protein
MISITEDAINCDQVHALVVGVETYELGPAYNLDGPAQDGLNFIDWLLSQGVLPGNIRFFVSPLPKNADVRSQAAQLGIKTSPATREAIDGYIREELITEQAKGEGLYVFWGGHGILTKTHSTTRRLLFADTSAANKLNLDVNSLVQALSRSAYSTGFRKQIFLVDACAKKAYQELHEMVQSEVAGQRYSATGEQDSAEQFVMFAAVDYGVALNGLDTGLFSSAVLAELQGQPLWPDMKVLAERVKASFEAQNRPEVYWWIRGQGYEEFSKQIQQTRALLKTVQQSEFSIVKKRVLERRIETLTAQYEALNEQYDDCLDDGMKVILNSKISKLDEKLASLNLEIC